MNEKMKTALGKTLRPGESIEWESETQHFRIQDGKEGQKTVLQWIISSLCYVAILGIYIAHNALTPRFVILLSLIYFTLIVTPVLSYRQVLGQRYFLTNQRAILIRKDGIVCTMERDNINTVKLYPVKPGAAIVLGKSIQNEGDKMLRWRSLHAKENPNNVGGLNSLGLVFYNVRNAECAVKLLDIQ